MNKIEIYTNTTCGYCKTTKEELTKIFKEHGKNERSIHSNNE